MVNLYQLFPQESLVYANRSLEAVPGEKILRDNKEKRYQQNRLKEIDYELESLEKSLVSFLFFVVFFFPLSGNIGVYHSMCLKIKSSFFTLCKILKEIPKEICRQKSQIIILNLGNIFFFSCNTYLSLV